MQAFERETEVVEVVVGVELEVVEAGRDQARLQWRVEDGGCTAPPLNLPLLFNPRGRGAGVSLMKRMTSGVQTASPMA